MNRQLKQSLCAFFICLGVMGSLFLSSCVPATAKKEMTPEEKQAYQDSIAKVHKGKLDLLWSLGWEPFKQEDYETAKKFFVQVAKLDTTGIYSKMLYKRLGYCYEYSSMEDSAMWAYELGVKRVPEDPYLWQRIADIKTKKGEYNQAVDIYKNTLIQLEPENVEFYKNLGDLYRNKLNNDELALEAYTKANELDPEDTEIQGILDQLITSPEENIEVQLKILANNPDDIRARKKIAANYITIGEYGKAIENLEYALTKEPENIACLNLLGKAQAESNKHTQAVVTYKKIISLDPDEKTTYCNLSMSYTALGRYAAAIAQAKKALRIAPKYGLPHIAIGMAYETCADRCVESSEDKKRTFDDKLVYKLAYDAYLRGKTDIEYRSDAEARANYVLPYIPLESDYFMNKGHNKPVGDCYAWIH